MLLTHNNHVAVLGDRLEGGRLARNLAPEAARRLQIDVAQRNNRVARVVQLQLKTRAENNGQNRVYQMVNNLQEAKY